MNGTTMSQIEIPVSVVSKIATAVQRDPNIGKVVWYPPENASDDPAGLLCVIRRENQNATAGEPSVLVAVSERVEK